MLAAPVTAKGTTGTMNTSVPGRGNNLSPQIGH